MKEPAVIEVVRTHFSQPHVDRAMECIREPDEFKCLYLRESDGAKCAFGLLIPDEVYEPRMEELSLRDILDQYSVVNDLVIGDDHPGDEREDFIHFLEDVQSCHDESSDTEDLLERLDGLARAHGITP